jgi:hypothetical protein
MQNKMIFHCLCGKQIELELIGGQYQTAYQGECECGRKWYLEEQSEIFAELDEEK